MKAITTISMSDCHTRLKPTAMQFVSDGSSIVKYAMLSTNSAEWKVVMKEETHSLMANNTRVMTDLTPGGKAIKST